MPARPPRPFHALPAALAMLAVLIAPVAAQAERVERITPESQVQMTLSFAPVVQAAAPAVVNIYATRVVEERLSPFAGDPFFEQLFRDFGRGTPRVQNSLGSGVIVGADGIVVSNYHVVGQATEIRVVLADRREFAAEVILGDEESDLAILQMKDAAGLPVLTFRDSDELQVGDLVLAIGNPFGVGQTVSSGIVSGLARSAYQLGDGRGYFIQTDAAINPGNSGGALVDMQGRLAGINTAILSRGGGSNGIGFAIPSNLVAKVVEQARGGAAEFQRPWAGVTGQPVDAGMAEALDMPRPEGVLLTEVHPQSPLAAAGLQAGDVVTALEGAPTNTPQEMMFRLAAAGMGRQVAVQYWRDGTGAEALATLAPAPDTPDRMALTVTGSTPLAGLSVARINPALMAEWNLPLSAAGTIVTAVDSYAAGTGLEPGDIIAAVNGAGVATPADVQALSQVQSRRWTLDVLRQGQPMRLRFRL